MVYGKASPSEHAHVEGLVRSFLQAQFIEVLELLRANRPLLERIAHALAERGMLFQHDLEALAEGVS